MSKKKSLIKVFLFSFLFFNFTQIVEAENIEEGKVIYQFKYNYDAIYKVLNLNQEQYEEYWENGLSISEMAEKQGILKRDLVSYFVGFHYDEMQRWRRKGSLSEEDYFDLVYILKEDINEFIERNPN